MRLTYAVGGGGKSWPQAMAASNLSYLISKHVGTIDCSWPGRSSGAIARCVSPCTSFRIDPGKETPFRKDIRRASPFSGEFPQPPRSRGRGERRPATSSVQCRFTPVSYSNSGRNLLSWRVAETAAKHVPPRYFSAAGQDPAGTTPQGEQGEAARRRSIFKMNCPPRLHFEDYSPEVVRAMSMCRRAADFDHVWP